MDRRTTKGLSLLELMVVTLIMTIVVGGSYLIFSSGQGAWFTTDVKIRLQENLRKTVDRVSVELRQSQVGQGQIFDGAGPNNSDVIRFSVPVVCEVGGSLLDANGDVAYWGAPLNWGCTDSTCMDADDDCLTVDYKSIEYRINNSNQLVRRVLDDLDNLVRQDIFAENITDLQIILNAAGVINLTVTAQRISSMNRVLTAQAVMDVYLRN